MYVMCVCVAFYILQGVKLRGVCNLTCNMHQEKGKGGMEKEKPGSNFVPPPAGWQTCLFRSRISFSKDQVISQSHERFSRLLHITDKVCPALQQLD